VLCTQPVTDGSYGLHRTDTAPFTDHHRRLDRARRTSARPRQRESSPLLPGLRAEGLLADDAYGSYRNAVV
jgi:hypothetical protein